MPVLLGNFYLNIFAYLLSLDGRVNLWRVDGKLIKSFQAHQGPAWGLAFSPDGKSIATSGGDAAVKLWTLLAPVNALAIAPDGETIASGGSKTIKLWNFEGKLLHSFPAHGEIIWKLAFSSDGRYIASASSDRTAKLWKTDGSLVATLNHDSSVWGVAFSPQNNFMVFSVAFTGDGKFLVSGEEDGTVLLWDLQKIIALHPLNYACDWVRDYLRTSAEVEEGDRSLCDNIGNGE